jgi:hypothetical protein
VGGGAKCKILAYANYVNLMGHNIQCHKEKRKLTVDVGLEINAKM